MRRNRGKFKAFTLRVLSSPVNVLSFILALVLVIKIRADIIASRLHLTLESKEKGNK